MGRFFPPVLCVCVFILVFFFRFVFSFVISGLLFSFLFLLLWWTAPFLQTSPQYCINFILSTNKQPSCDPQKKRGEAACVQKCSGKDPLVREVERPTLQDGPPSLDLQWTFFDPLLGR